MAATDDFASWIEGLNTPARYAEAVTPHNTNELTKLTRGLWVGTGGSVALVMADNPVSIILDNIPNGAWLPFRVRKVLSTGTTASDIIAFS